MVIGKLESVDLRELWKHEEYDFSTWLQNNIDALSKALDISILSVEREKMVGSFQVDLVGKDSDGNLVIIENQLEQTNHDHLGKLLTYLTNLGAKTAVWITSDPRPEHIKAIAWLNEETPINFYLVSIAAYKIGDSIPAPLFTVIVSPSESDKEEQEEQEEKSALYKKFWEQLLARAKEKGVMLHSTCSRLGKHYIDVRLDKGLYLVYVIWDTGAAVHLYISGKDRSDKQIFDSFYSEREKIESDFGDTLDWDRRDTAKYSLIRYYIESGLEGGESNWPSLQDAMIDAMGRLSQALKPYIQALKEDA